MKINIITYGCTANYDNTAIMKGILGERIVDDVKEADVVVLNSCIVKQKTEQRVRSKIKDITENYPNKKLIIAGCMPKALADDCRKIAPNASLVDTNHVTDILKAVDKRVELIEERKENKIGLRKVFDKEASIQIAEGCVNNCSYCIVKLAKGELKSFSRKEVVDEVKELVKKYKRINLTATDCGCYGFNINDNIVNLLRDVVNVKGDFIIRVGMMNPGFVIKYLDGLVEVFKNKKIMKFLHIPVQSGSDKVLRDMDRNYRVKDFLKIVNKFRKEIPEINISSDIIVGYPTESEEDFGRTVELIKKVKPEVLNISKFGVRKGTRAEKLKQLSSKIIKRRSVELNKVYKSLKS